MKTADGRQWATREDLITHSGYSRTTLAELWRERRDNGHPEARDIDGAMHWDLALWDTWFAAYRQLRQPPRDLSKVDRTGDPDELLPPAKQAKLLDVDPARITQYDKKPPPHWPAPAEVVQLPTRTRNLRTRQQLWDFVDNPESGFGTAGGQPAGPSAKTRAKTPDPRVRQAAEALAELPAMTVRELAAVLAERHGWAPTTWLPFITEARAEDKQQ